MSLLANLALRPRNIDASTLGRDAMAGASLRALFAADPQRFASLSLRFEDLMLDYSKHLVEFGGARWSCASAK